MIISRSDEAELEETEAEQERESGRAGKKRGDRSVSQRWRLLCAAAQAARLSPAVSRSPNLRQFISTTPTLSSRAVVAPLFIRLQEPT